VSERSPPVPLPDCLRSAMSGSLALGADDLALDVSGDQDAAERSNHSEPA